MGLDLRDGSPKLLDLRFADDILLFCNSGHEASWLLDIVVRYCSHVGWLLKLIRRTFQKHNHHRNYLHQMGLHTNGWNVNSANTQNDV